MLLTRRGGCRMSELRVIELLEGLCSGMGEYEYVAEDKNASTPARWARTSELGANRNINRCERGRRGRVKLAATGRVQFGGPSGVLIAHYCSPSRAAGWVLWGSTV